jgi:hypothetical protein
MPKFSAPRDIKEAYPDLDDVPTTAEIYIVAPHPTTGIPTDYNVFLGDLDELIGAVTVGSGDADIDDGTITNAMLVEASALTLKGNLTGATAAVTDNEAAAVRTFLSIEANATGDLTDAEAAAQFTAIAADEDLNVALGGDVLTALDASLADDDDAFYGRLDDLGQVYSRTSITEGQIILGNVTGTTEVAGTTGVNLAADPYAHTSSGNAIAIDFADGHGMFRTHATTQNTKITVSNVPTYFEPKVQITATGSHTITFQASIKVHPAAYKTAGISLTSGQTTTVRYTYDGTTIHAFVWAAGETST